MNAHTPGYKEQQIAGQGAILLCALLWSTSGLFIKLVNWHPVVISGSRSLLAALFLLAIRFFSRRSSRTYHAEKVKVLPLFAAGLWYAATMILFVIANKLTASANAILLQYTAPVWAGILGWFALKERPRWEHWGALAVTGLGMFLVFRGGLAAGSVLGDCFALLSGLTFGANSVVMRKQKDGNPADIMICAHILCVLFTVPFVFIYRPAITGGNIVSILFMGILQIGAASALFAYGIRRISAVQAMLTATIEPVLNPLWVLLVTGEKPALSVVAGGAIIVGAVALSSVIGRMKE
jgi:drug/metabolite transporter (DMT)-like permease